MLPAVVAVVLMLGSHGEAPREVKFQGALLAQADLELPVPPMPPPLVNVPAMQRELDQLLRTRPSLKPGTIVLVVGGGVSLLGVSLIVAGSIGAGWTGLGVVVIGLLVGISGAVVGVIGGVMMIAEGIALHDADARIEDLKARISRAAPPRLPEPPPSTMKDSLSTVLLARF